MKFATNPRDNIHLTLCICYKLPWEFLKNSNLLQTFSRYGRNANKLHFNCLWA